MQTSVIIEARTSALAVAARLPSSEFNDIFLNMKEAIKVRSKVIGRQTRAFENT
jgi:hypothetical protein